MERILPAEIFWRKHPAKSLIFAPTQDRGIACAVEQIPNVAEADKSSSGERHDCTDRK
jgi:hypothetical protein